MTGSVLRVFSVDDVYQIKKDDALYSIFNLLSLLNIHQL